MVKPSVVRPRQPVTASSGNYSNSSSNSSGSSSYLGRAPASSYRREPEGIEGDSSSIGKKTAAAAAPELMGGSYDHAAEYDPYQSAAKQMQELLFGSSSSENKDITSTSPSANLRPSTNSAFVKYVPSTADINTKMNAKTR